MIGGGQAVVRKMGQNGRDSYVVQGIRGLASAARNQ
jgi:hypothetical protein